MKKRLFLLLALSAIAVAGCSQPPQKYGNLAKVDSATLVEEITGVMTANYPPAKTRLDLMHDADDTFGTGLVQALREHGYAVSEYSLPSQEDGAPVPVAESPGLAFAYILDVFPQTKELRITLFVGNESLSRVYVVQETDSGVSYVPKGYWSRKE